MSRSFIIPFVLMPWSLTGSAVLAQDTLVVVFGVVRDYTTKEALQGVAVNAIDQKWGRRLSAVTNEAGKYELDFTEEGTFMVEFSGPGRAPKKVLLDLTGPTSEEWLGGYGMNVDITLFLQLDGIDLSMGGRPWGKSAYNRADSIFEWDLAYTQGIQAEASKLIAEYEKRLAVEAVPTAR